LVQSVLGLSERPRDSDGPEQIPAWDSLGTLRLLLAIEETLGITLHEGEMRAANTVATLSEIVEAKLNGSARTGVEITP
jgi:acyl carrier protein